jgi:hypothetical protein
MENCSYHLTRVYVAKDDMNSHPQTETGQNRRQNVIFIKVWNDPNVADNYLWRILRIQQCQVSS